MNCILFWKGWCRERMGLFPAYIVSNQTLTESKTIMVPKEYEIDYKTGLLTGRIVEGLEAIKVWIWLVLQTPRYRYYIYTWDYGNEFEDLIGQGYTEEYINTEAQRMTGDCLLINENIQSISDFSVEMQSDQLTVSFTANTIYGSIRFSNEKVVNTI